jgi:hypothetical protein
VATSHRVVYWLDLEPIHGWIKNLGHRCIRTEGVFECRNLAEERMRDRLRPAPGIDGAPSV